MSKFLELQGAIQRNLPPHIRVLDRYSRWGTHQIYFHSGFGKIK